MTGPTRLYGSSTAASALVDSRLCGNDDPNLDSVIPAKAGIHAASPEHDRALAGTASNLPARQRGQVP